LTPPPFPNLAGSVPTTGSEFVDCGIAPQKFLYQ
jgi:hypothetical protein